MLSGQFDPNPSLREIIGATHAVRNRVNRTNGTRMLGLEASLLACSEVRNLSSLPWSNFNPKAGGIHPNEVFLTLQVKIFQVEEKKGDVRKKPVTRKKIPI